MNEISKDRLMEILQTVINLLVTEYDYTPEDIKEALEIDEDELEVLQC